MNSLEQLATYAGDWHGINTLQDPNTGAPEDSATTATITPVLGGRFVRMDYTWSYQGNPQEGSFLFGYEAEAEVVTAHWIDTWHMSDKVMACRGAGDAIGQLNVLGSFAAPPGPDWGWRTVIMPEQDQMIGVVMFNISPDGEEYLAVEANYTRP